MTPAQEQEILNLRTLKLTPKQIAWKLGIKVLEVNATIHNQAEQRTSERLVKGELLFMSRLKPTFAFRQGIYSLDIWSIRLELILWMMRK
jgi:hypothetical protein